MLCAVYPMSYINPLAGSVASSSAAQKLQAGDKDRQARHTEALRRNSAAPATDHYEHTVENVEEAIGVHEDQKERQQRRPRKQNPHKKDTSEVPDDASLDLRA